MVTPTAVEDDRYHDAVETIVTGFRYELCWDCMGDIDVHAIIPGPLGLPFALCLSAVDPEE